MVMPDPTPRGRRSTRLPAGAAAPVAAAAVAPVETPAVASASPKQAPVEPVVAVATSPASAPSKSAKKKKAKKASGDDAPIARTTLASLEIAAEKARLLEAANAAGKAAANNKGKGADRGSQHPLGRQPATNTQTTTVLLSGLTTDLSQIYHKSVGAFAGNLMRGVPPPTILRSTDGASLLFRTSTKHDAQQLWKRLDRTVVFGRKLRATYAPVSAVEPSASPTAVDVTMSEPALSLPQVEAVLATMPGLLAVTDGDAPNECLATFADEGTALHARAVLSGRRQEGSFLFLSIRRDVSLEGPGASDSDDDDTHAAPAPKSPVASIAAARQVLEQL